MRPFIKKIDYNIRVDGMIYNYMFLYHRNSVYNVDLTVRQTFNIKNYSG